MVLKVVLHIQMIKYMQVEVNLKTFWTGGAGGQPL